MMTLSRDVPIDPAHAALLFIDVQNYSAFPERLAPDTLDAAAREARYGYFLRRLNGTVVPNLQKLQAASRSAGIEVLYTVIENLTQDGRDRGLDYKISGIDVPKGSWEAQVIDAVKPLPDEIVIPKTSSSVFISTNIDYVLRNLGVRSLILVGLLTDQCVDSAARDACDLGYLVTVVTDACGTYSEERHVSSLRNNRGYCRQMTTATLLDEIATLSRR
jgi:ureidoacrylate peracid hydrolase